MDGFNLYYPIKEHAAETGHDHLKWLNLVSLGARIASARAEDLAGVTYCTAYRDGDPDGRNRHRLYNSALRHVGVEILLGHYMKEPARACSACGHSEEKQSEKQTDINVALALFRGAMNDEFDTAYLLSADSDQAATASHFKQQFPDKNLVSVAPPNRKHSRKVLEHADAKFTATIELVSASRFPSVILRQGQNPIRCPREYDLPPRDN